MFAVTKCQPEQNTHQTPNTKHQKSSKTFNLTSWTCSTATLSTSSDGWDDFSVLNLNAVSSSESVNDERVRCRLSVEIPSVSKYLFGSITPAFCKTTVLAGHVSELTFERDKSSKTPSDLPHRAPACYSPKLLSTTYFSSCLSQRQVIKVSSLDAPQWSSYRNHHVTPPLEYNHLYKTSLWCHEDDSHRYWKIHSKSGM